MLQIKVTPSVLCGPSTSYNSILTTENSEFRLQQEKAVLDQSTKTFRVTYNGFDKDNTFQDNTFGAIKMWKKHETLLGDRLRSSIETTHIIACKTSVTLSLSIPIHTLYIVGSTGSRNGSECSSLTNVSSIAQTEFRYVNTSLFASNALA